MTAPQKKEVWIVWPTSNQSWRMLCGDLSSQSHLRTAQQAATIRALRDTVHLCCLPPNGEHYLVFRKDYKFHHVSPPHTPCERIQMIARRSLCTSFESHIKAAQSRGLFRKEPSVSSRLLGVLFVRCRTFEPSTRQNSELTCDINNLVAKRKGGKEHEMNNFFQISRNFVKQLLPQILANKSQNELFMSAKFNKTPLVLC